MTKYKRIATGAALLVAVGACASGDPVTPAGDEFGRASLVTGSASSASLPAGTANVFGRFGGFVTDVTDAFSRMPTNATQARRTQAYIGVAGFSAFEYYPDAGRNASPELLDPRLPAIQSTTAILDLDNGFMDLYAPNPASGYPGDWWELFTVFAGLNPNTQYQVVFVHYRLQVNGELDQVERLLTGTVTQPDSLIKVSGTQAEVNTDWTDAAPEGCDPYPGPTANPFAVATLESDADGFLVFDKCWTPGNGLWDLSSFDQQPKSMIGRNDNVAYDLPNYNYIEVWEGTYGAQAGPVFRLQVAQDLDLNGKPIPNAFAPFPAPGVTAVGTGDPPLPDQQTAFPLPQDVLAQLNGAIAVPDSTTLTINNLQLLSQGAYKVWYVNPTSGAAVPAVGRYERKIGDVVQSDAAAATSTFAGGPGTITFTTQPYLTDAGSYEDSLQFIVVTKETDPAAATPSTSQPLWQRLFKIPPGSAGGNLFFGNFNLGGSGRQRFVAQGTVTGGVLGDTVRVNAASGTGTEVVFRGSTVDLVFRGLTRPPPGYQYEGFLRKKVVTGAETQDTSVVDIGGLIDQSGGSLDDADATSSAAVTATSIPYGRLRFDVATGNPAGDAICDYDRIRLYLVAKGGATDPNPPTVIFNMSMPGRISGSARCE